MVNRFIIIIIIIIIIIVIIVSENFLFLYVIQDATALWGPVPAKRLQASCPFTST